MVDFSSSHIVRLLVVFCDPHKFINFYWKVVVVVKDRTTVR